MITFANFNPMQSFTFYNISGLPSWLTLLFTAGCSLYFSPAKSQEPIIPKPVPVEIQKKDATRLTGKLMGTERDSVRFKDLNNNEFRIALKDIRNIEYIDSLKKNKNWFEAPNSIRYLLSPSAIPLAKNEIMMESTYIFLTSMRYGISNSVSVAVGGELLFKSTYYANVKVTLWKNPNYTLSTSLNYYRLPSSFLENYYGDEIRNFGMISCMNTWGNTNHHLTISGGYLYAFNQFLPPTVTVSGSTRLGKHIALVSENWFLFVTERTGLPVILSLGLRIMGKQGAFDVGFYNDSESLDGVGLPYVGYTYRIQK